MSAVTRLYIVRHGATKLTAEDRFSGADGVELSDEGREQAAKLGERLRHEHVCSVYSSPLSRTMDTAKAIAAPCAVNVEKRDGLREIAHGHWEGLARADV